MSKESEALREGIRTGAIPCPCRRVMLNVHFPECEWRAAVDRIYEIEREEEGDNGRV